MNDLKPLFSKEILLPANTIDDFLSFSVKKSV